METISIINSFNEKYLMENLLILNQEKIINLVIDIFENDFKDIDSDNLTLEFVKEHMNKQNFINWELFLRLLNLKTTVKFFSWNCSNNLSGKTLLLNSLTYIFYYYLEKKQTCNQKIIKFLLKLPNDYICWNASNLLIFNKLFMFADIFNTNNFVLDLVIKHPAFDTELWTYIDTEHESCAVRHFLLNCKNNSTIKEIFNQGKIGIDEKIIYNNCIFSPIIFLISSKNIECIKYLLDLNVNLDNDIIYIYLNTCDCIDIFTLLDEYNFDLMKKDANGKLLFNVNNITSEVLMKYFITKGYVELYEQIFYKTLLYEYFDVLKILDEYNFDLMKKDLNGKLLSNIININSEFLMEYFITQKYVELYEQIFNNALLYNHKKILDKYFTNNLIDLDKISSIQTIIKLVNKCYFTYAKTIMIKYFILSYTNIYDNIKYYYIDSYEHLLEDKHNTIKYYHIDLLNDNNKND